jgi:hypothetical protein
MSRGKLGQRIRQDVGRELPTEDVVVRSGGPPPQLEGDALLAWLREHDPDHAPTDDELAAVELIGADVTSESPEWLYAELWHAGADEVREYFEREASDIVQSDAGARLNGLHRERAERDGLPSGRWDMGRSFTGQDAAR